MLIHQILNNLISNAIKFSAAGDKIIVYVGTKIIDSESVEVTIKIKDYGIGISEQDQKILFEPYFESSDIETRASSSSDTHGMGLYICSRICSGLKGKLTVSSLTGESTEVTF
jgi:two-component system sensor histidine kinase EvgS